MLVRETAQSFNVPKNLLHNRLTGIINRSETELLLALCVFWKYFFARPAVTTGQTRYRTRCLLIAFKRKGSFRMAYELTKDMHILQHLKITTSLLGKKLL
jgi:hypothetical protein